MPEPRSPDRGSGCPLGGVRERGVEPPRPFGHTDLNRARLPIPPLAREARSGYPTPRRPPKPAAGDARAARGRHRTARYDAWNAGPPNRCALLRAADRGTESKRRQPETTPETRPGHDGEEAAVGILQRFEDRLEQFVSGVFAKAFRSAV